MFALALTALVTAIAPRPYNYQKVFLPALALLALWRYVDAPSARHSVLVAACTALAFAFRLDHGVTVALAVGAMLLAVHWQDGLQDTLRQLVRFAVPLIVFLVPVLLYILAHGGVALMVEQTLGAAAAESRRTNLFRFPGMRFGQLSLLSVTTLPPTPLRLINVRWAPGVTATQRGALEAGHHLTGGQSLGDRTWQYELLDTSRDNLRALIAVPEAEDTHKIDRRTLQLSDQPRESVWVTWQR